MEPDKIGEVFVTYFVAFTTVFTFPIYLYTYRVNEKNDKKLPIFPFVQQFFYIALIIEITFTLNYILLVVRKIIEIIGYDVSTITSISDFFLIIHHGEMRILPASLSLLMFFLSIQRFVIFFIIKYVTVKRSKILKLAYFIYFFVIGTNICWEAVCRLVKSLGTDFLFCNKFISGNLFTFYLSYLGITIAMLVYISISISVRNIQNNHDNSRNRIQHSAYIISQTILVLIIKTVLLITIIYPIDFEKYYPNYQIILEYAFTPIFIHFSYIFTSRKNYQIAKGFRFSKSCFRIMFGYKKNQVYTNQYS
ncbi:unnamed protein product [Caenorhabditis angaria]|uniref:Uncharacterized protein n=1 Tax=Caenorhabditis angaria TaxID=860376 RepID=A0A9P1IW33_9PELO|nr:unnamed protein product [Caenorhabditis angaria]